MQKLGVTDVVLDPEARFDAFLGRSAAQGAEGGRTEAPEGVPVAIRPPLVKGVPDWRERRAPVANALGLVVDPELDRCFHLNPGYRGGSCLVNGNAPCPFLGGNQSPEACPDFLDRDEERRRRLALPKKDRLRPIP